MQKKISKENKFTKHKRLLVYHREPFGLDLHNVIKPYMAINIFQQATSASKKHFFPSETSLDCVCHRVTAQRSILFRNLCSDA